MQRQIVRAAAKPVTALSLVSRRSMATANARPLSPHLVSPSPAALTGRYDEDNRRQSLRWSSCGWHEGAGLADGSCPAQKITESCEPSPGFLFDEGSTWALTGIALLWAVQEIYKLSIPMVASGAFRFAGMVMFFGGYLAERASRLSIAHKMDDDGLAGTES